MTFLQFAAIVCLVLLSLGAVGAIYRIVKGPSLLDRVVATDVLLIIVSSALCVEMALNHHTTNVMFVVAASLIGFVGSVTVARNVTDRVKEGS